MKTKPNKRQQATSATSHKLQVPAALLHSGTSVSEVRLALGLLPALASNDHVDREPSISRLDALRLRTNMLMSPLNEMPKKRKRPAHSRLTSLQRKPGKSSPRGRSQGLDWSPEASVSWPGWKQASMPALMLDYRVSTALKGISGRADTSWHREPPPPSDLYTASLSSEFFRSHGDSLAEVSRGSVWSVRSAPPLLLSGGVSMVRLPVAPEDTEGPTMLSARHVFLMHSLAESRDSHLANTAASYKETRAEGPPREWGFAAVKIQALWRGFAQRRRYLSLLAAASVKPNQAAIAIQRCYRYRLRRREGRLWREREAIRRKIEQDRVSAIQIQRVWRGLLGRRRAVARRIEIQRTKAATKIQAQARRRPVQRQYRRDVRRVILIQALIRGGIARARYREAQHAVVTIQAWLRGFAVRMRVQAWHKAAVTIERVWRGVRGRRRAAALKAAWRQALREGLAAGTIQRVARGRAGRKLFAFEQVLASKRELMFLQAESRYRSDPSKEECVANYVSFAHATMINDTTDLAKMYIRALEAWPDNSALNVGYALLLRFLGRKADKAAKHLKTAVASDPGLVRWRESEETFFHGALRLSLNTGPGVAKSYATLAITRLWIHKDYLRASKYFAAAVKRDPYDPLIAKHFDNFTKKFQVHLTDAFFADRLVSSYPVVVSDMHLAVEVYRRGLNYLFKTKVPQPGRPASVGDGLVESEPLLSALPLREDAVRELVCKLDTPELLQQPDQLMKKLLSFLVLRTVTAAKPDPTADEKNDHGLAASEELLPEGSRVLDIKFKQDPFSPMTHLTSSGHFLTITIHPLENMDLQFYALNTAAGTEYKLLLPNATVQALFRDHPKWLQARTKPGWRVSARPLLVQAVRWLELQRKPPPPPPSDSVDPAEEMRAKKFGYNKEKLAEGKKKVAAEITEASMLKAMYMEFRFLRSHRAVPILASTTEETAASPGGLQFTYRSPKPRIRLDDLMLVIPDLPAKTSTAGRNFGATCVQKLWRGHKGRYLAKQRVLHVAAAKIQRFWMHHGIVHLILELRIRMHRYLTARAIQRQWRRHSSMRSFSAFLLKIFPFSGGAWTVVMPVMRQQRTASERYSAEGTQSALLEAAYYAHSFGGDVDAAVPLYELAAKSSSNPNLLLSLAVALCYSSLLADGEHKSVILERVRSLVRRGRRGDKWPVLFSVVYANYFQRAKLVLSKCLRVYVTDAIIQWLIFDNLEAADAALNRAKALESDEKVGRSCSPAWLTDAKRVHALHLNLVQAKESRRRAVACIARFWRKFFVKRQVRNTIRHLRVQKAAKRELNRNPSDMESVLRYAYLLQAVNHDFEGAAAMYEKAIGLAPDSSSEDRLKLSTPAPAWPDGFLRCLDIRPHWGLAVCLLVTSAEHAIGLAVGMKDLDSSESWRQAMAHFQYAKAMLEAAPGRWTGAMDSAIEEFFVPMTRDGKAASTGAARSFLNLALLSQHVIGDLENASVMYARGELLDPSDKALQWFSRDLVDSHEAYIPSEDPLMLLEARRKKAAWRREHGSTEATHT